MFERNLKKFTKIKTRNFLILIVLVILSTIVVWLFNSPTPHLRSFVSKTQLHIKNINSKLQALEPDSNAKDLEVDSTYLELLGFVKEPKLFKESKTIIDENGNHQMAPVAQLDNFNSDLILNKINTRIPPLVTAFTHFTEKEKALIESKLKYFLNDLILVYDLDLSSSEQLKIKKLCNSSCSLKMFKADKYPRHLIESKMKAYKPIIIQEVLNEYGALIWIEPPNVFISNKVDKYLNKSKLNGILAWPKTEPITQMTHPSMFKYFKTRPADFYFVHMLDTTQFILYNNQQIHTNLMLPWVKCALKEDCISPRGSKFHGCDYSRRPSFLYSGCHRYEMSAFSIITAMMYNFDQTKYTMAHDTNTGNSSSSSNSEYSHSQSIGTLVSSKDLDDVSSFIKTYYENSFMTAIVATKQNDAEKQLKPMQESKLNH